MAFALRERYPNTVYEIGLGGQRRTCREPEWDESPLRREAWLRR